MKILLTGASGFIGSYFINKYTTKYKIKTFSFLKDDFSKLILDNVDTIIHLSALVHQMDGATEEEYESINVTPTYKLAKKAKEMGVKHFIFMSSIKVYGEETDVPYHERSVCSPQDLYGKSKLKAEQKILLLEDERFHISIVRTPIVYGCGVKANIRNLIHLVKKVPILPFYNIQNRRSMVYVGNLCHLMDMLIGYNIKHNKVANIFLASDDEPLSTTMLIDRIAKGLNKKIYFIKIPFFENVLRLIKPNFHKRLYESLEVDNSITKEILELKNPYSVEDGIRCMLCDNEFINKDAKIQRTNKC